MTFVARLRAPTLALSALLTTAAAPLAAQATGTVATADPSACRASG